MSVRSASELVKRTLSECKDDKVSRLAAALAYYTTFSIAPLLVIAIGAAGLFFGAEAARREVSAQLGGLLGPPATQILEMTVASARRNESAGVLATVVGFVVLIFGASGVFASLQDALNTIWEVRPKPDLGWAYLVRSRLFSFAMVLVIAFLLMVSLVISAGLAALESYAGGRVQEAVLWRAINFGISIGVFTLLFAMMYKFLPDVKIGWRDVWIGAAITAALFSLGEALIGLYIAKSSVTSAYGAAGSLVVLLLWVYYSAHIVFFGAEFTQVYARRHGRHIEPSEHAEQISERQRDEEGLARDKATRGASGSPQRMRARAGNQRGPSASSVGPARRMIDGMSLVRPSSRSPRVT
jgi:membrane protein